MTGTLYQQPTWADLALERTFPDLKDVTMADPTDAAVEAEYQEIRKIWMKARGDTHATICAVARRAILSRQPKPEDLERVTQILREVSDKWIAPVSVARLRDMARAILAIYDAPARIPTRSDLDSALDPILGDSKARRAVVDVVLGVVGACPGNTALADENATLLREQALHRQDYDKLFAQLVTTQAELAAAKSAQSGTIRLGEGLTEAQEGLSPRIKNIIADAMSDAANLMDKFAWRDTKEDGNFWRNVHMRLHEMATALRASAAPMAEVVDWLAIAKDRTHACGRYYSNAEVIDGLCQQIDALRSAAGGSV